MFQFHSIIFVGPRQAARISELNVTKTQRQTDDTLTTRLRIRCPIHPPGTQSCRISLTCSSAPPLSCCLTAITLTRPRYSLTGWAPPSSSTWASSSRPASHRSRPRVATSLRWRMTWPSRMRWSGIRLISLVNTGRSSQRWRSLCMGQGCAPTITSWGAPRAQEGGENLNRGSVRSSSCPTGIVWTLTSGQSQRLGSPFKGEKIEID